MRATSLVTVLMALVSFAAAQGANCSTPCYKIPDILQADNNPCGISKIDPPDGCHCEFLERAKSHNLYKHNTGTKIEIYPGNVLHLWCHNSHCLRFTYCSISVRYMWAWKSVPEENGEYELPPYNDCCTLPKGTVTEAWLREPGY